MPLSIGHIDIASLDPTASGAFYRELLGWECETNEELGYTWFSDGRVNGGFPDLVKGFEPVRRQLEPGDVLLYVEVEEETLEGAVDRARGLGAEVLLGPTEVAPGTGDRLAIIRDPQGTKLALTYCERLHAV
jgi:predicted enzyme related to lactoylglutathione lyase